MQTTDRLTAALGALAATLAIVWSIATLAAGGMAPDQQRQVLDNLLTSQSVMLATNHIMLIVALICCAAAFFIWLAPKPTRAVDMTQAGH
ncbi:MAG TPA: hypothetical protein VFJ70_19855 [Burkholderiales bacterium]|nr:hypothetical protein [Burkholderiales bacterium]